MIKVVFIAGPYNGSCLWQFRDNIIFAEDIAAELWQEGAAVICPHTNSGHMHGAAPEFMFLEGYQEILSRCDAVYALAGWEQSSGARAEVAEARKRNIPVFTDLRDITAWLKTP